jgi:hypothetical protein
VLTVAAWAMAMAGCLFVLVVGLIIMKLFGLFD